MEKRALILDVDGTLWDTTGVVAEAWRAAVYELGLPVKQAELIASEVTPERLKREFGKPMDQIADSLFPQLSDAQRAEALRLCCTLEDAYLERCTRDLLYSGVREAMRALAAQRRLYIVSNCQSGYIELFLRKSGLTDCVRDFECYGNTGKYKAENIRLLMHRNGLTAPEAVYVGDTQGDCDAAKAAGIAFVHAAYGFGTADSCERVLGSFSEAEKLA